jgi:hypothetical protein
MSGLSEEIDIFAGHIKDALKAADELYALSVQIKNRIATIEQAAREAQGFTFVDRKIKDDCRRLCDSADDINHRLNAMELGSRGLQVKNVMEKVWRELP